ncbi:MAG TPA: DUF4396 domain-containing protein [Solirubrobacteraceae bacterium]|nr:DUF4396 domain-containing protein [Solirubrobacteraceae bacterium]
MEATAHEHQHHHEPLPTSGRALDGVALSATLHCLTGCAIGEITGMIIGTALGFSDLGTIALAVGLAFLFGYTLTSLPLLRAGLALGAVVPIALASDTASIAVMEIVDNAILLAIPGAMDAHLDSVLFWGALSVALVIAGLFAFPLNRWLIARGRGHAAVHETGIHGGPNVRVVGAIAAVAGVFGTAVIVGELVSGGDSAGAGGGHAGMSEEPKAAGGHAAEAEGGQDAVRGLAASEGGLKLELARTQLRRGAPERLSLRIVGSGGRPVRDFEVEHEKRMHLIVVRRDTQNFQHLHPTMAADGTWSTPVTLREPGNYRVFADFKRDGKNSTLASDVAVDGPASWQAIPPATRTARATGGFEVRVSGADSRAGSEAELRFEVTRAGEHVDVEPYLGARGHLVALREGDLAYLHVHPVEGESASGEDAGHGEAESGPIAFATEFPTAGRYRLFLQFKHEGRVQTAAFTREVAR